MTADYLSSLNPEQRLAVTTTEGAVLVLSGAGTGKTSVLVRRTLHILVSGLAAPWQIMALTFTNKAANEMKNRLANSIRDPQFAVHDLWCGTFHSICLRILRFNAERAGMRRDFLIFGEDDQKAVLKRIFADMGLDTKTYGPSEWVEKISAIKDKGINNQESVISGKVKDIFDAYNAELARLNAVDFGDIIIKVLELFENAPDILEKYQRQFKYIMVDEFQDTNTAQFQFIKRLADGKNTGNICCVGDDDQSIYSWRGAEIKNILEFEKTFPNAKVIRLETNYRSTENILNAANSLIRKNMSRLGKDLRAANGVGAGEKVYVATLPNEWDEVRMISRTIAREAPGCGYANTAILIRAGSLSRLFEEEFTEKGIPYRLVGATKFYDRMEIRDAIAYIRLLVYPFDDLSFMRIIAKPRRGFGDVALMKLRGFGGNMMSALRAAPISGKQRTAADEFLAAFDFDHGAMRPVDAATKLLNDSGYLKMWQDSKETDAPDRLENINELLANVISKYDTLGEFLEHAALMMTDDNDTEDNGDIKNAVSVMTIHAAKGLEFDTVFLPAWEEGIFPNEMAVGDGGLEEERRLAYVAITRARRCCIISNAMSRALFGDRKYNPPSRFIGEIDRDFLNIQGESRPAPRQHISPRPQSTHIRPRMPRSTSVVGKLADHDELGRGVIIEENDEILTIAFRKCGIKKVDRKYIKISH